MAAITPGSRFYPLTTSSSTSKTTGTYFEDLGRENETYGTTFRGEVNETYNRMLTLETMCRDFIPGADVASLDGNRDAPIYFPEIYELAIAKITCKYQVREGTLTTGTLFNVLNTLNVRHKTNIRGIVNIEYNRLLTAAGSTRIAAVPLIAGGTHDLEESGMDRASPITNPFLYEDVLANVLDNIGETGPIKRIFHPYTPSVFQAPRTPETVRKYSLITNYLLSTARKVVQSALSYHLENRDRPRRNPTFFALPLEDGAELREARDDYVLLDLARRTAEAALSDERPGVVLDLFTRNAKFLWAVMACSPEEMDRHLAEGADPTQATTVFLREDQRLPPAIPGLTDHTDREVRTHMDLYFLRAAEASESNFPHSLMRDYFCNPMVAVRNETVPAPDVVLRCKGVLLVHLAAAKAWGRRRAAVL